MKESMIGLDRAQPQVLFHRPCDATLRDTATGRRRIQVDIRTIGPNHRRTTFSADFGETLSILR